MYFTVLSLRPNPPHPPIIVEGTDRGGFLYLQQFKINKPEYRLMAEPGLHTLVMGIFHGMSDPAAGTMAPLRMLNIGEVPEVGWWLVCGCGWRDTATTCNLYYALYALPASSARAKTI